MLLEKESDVNIYYDDDKNIIKCPHCNIILFYINNNWEHECSMKINILVDEIIKGKKNEFLCNINKIENKCAKHNEEFSCYKNSNYYCDKCLDEKDIENFLILDEIELSKDEINDFNNLIKKFENILSEVEKINKQLLTKSDNDDLKKKL